MLAAVRSRLPALLGWALAIEFWAELALLVPAGTPHRGVAALLLGAMAVGLVNGRRAPLVGVVLVFGAVALLPALSREYYENLLLPFTMPFVATFWLGLCAGREQLAAGIALALPLGMLASVPYDDDVALTSVLFTLAITVGAPILVGRLLRSRAALHGTLRERAALLERRRADAAGRAVVDERTRIAGELHDVVAHALSGMTVQATGARRLALTRPDLAQAAFEAIERSGREALDELRRLLGVLRSEDAELTLAPQPSLRHVQSLARRTTAAGLPVTVRVEGEAGELAAGLDVTAYRVVQEALGAALNVGGAGRADVTVRYGADVLEIDVRDDGPLVAPRPLAGVRERVTLHGGRLTLAHRRSGGGHIVHATLPLDGQAMAGEEPEPVPCELAVRRDRVLRRLRDARPRRPEVFDATLAILLALAGIVEIAVSPDRSGPLAANVALALGYTLPLAWRRRSPVAATAAVIAAILVMGLTLTSVEQLFVPFAAVLCGAYACGLRESYPGLALVVIALPAITATMDDRVAADYFFPCLLVTVTWLAGRTVRARTRLTAELHEAAEQLAEASAEEQQLAASEERRRIAREMHDLVAHSMSVMVVQAGGARRILARDPGRALEAATRIERTGREALGEMRHLLGVLNGPQRGARPAAHAGRARRADHPRPRGRPPDRARIPRRAPRPPGGVGPRCLPDRPGRTHQCHQARRPRSHDGDRRLE